MHFECEFSPFRIQTSTWSHQCINHFHDLQVCIHLWTGWPVNDHYSGRESNAVVNSYFLTSFVADDFI